MEEQKVESGAVVDEADCTQLCHVGCGALLLLLLLLLLLTVIFQSSQWDEIVRLTSSVNCWIGWLADGVESVVSVETDCETAELILT